MCGVRGRALSNPRPPVLSGVRLGLTIHWLWVRGGRAWGPVTNPTARALASRLCALWGRQESCLRGRLLPGCGASGNGLSPTSDLSSFRACGRGPLPIGRGCGVRAWGPDCPWHLLPCRGSSCVVRASRVRGTRWLLWLGTCPCAVVVAGSVPLWRAPRHASSGPVPLGAAVSLPLAVVPSATPGAVAPGFTGWLRGARGGRPRTGLVVPAAGPCRGKGAGRAPRRTSSGPRDGVVPGGSLQLRSWAACAAVVWCVWTRTLTRPVSPYRPSLDGGLGRCPSAVSCGRQQLPVRVGGRHARVPRVCVCVRAPLGRAGRAGLPGAFCCASIFPVAVLSFSPVRPPPGWGCWRFGCFFLLLFVPVSFLFLFSLPWCPRRLWLFVLPGPGCLGPWRSLFLLRPPPLLFLSFRLCSPSHTLPAVLCVVAVGALGLGALLCTTTPFPSPFFLFLFVVFFPVVFNLFCAPSSRLPCLGLSFVSGPGCPEPWRSGSRLLFLFPFFSLFFVVFPFSRCCFALPLFLVPGALGALGLWSAWLGSFSRLSVRPCVWCVRCVSGYRLRRSLLVLSCCFVRACRCRVLLPVVAGWSLLDLVTRLLFSLACFGVGGPAWPRGSPPCCWLWVVVASRSPVLCPVFCASVLPCGGVLWCPAVCFALFCVWCGAVLLLGAVCGVLCLSSGGVLCPRRVPPAVLCWVWSPACRVVLFALAGAVCCRLWLPAVCCWVWLPAVVFLWCVLSRLLLPGHVACYPAVCCGLLWCRVPLRCVPCSVVLCCRAVPCCGPLLSGFVCWSWWFLSFPSVCSAMLRCASCCSVLVWSALLSVPRAVACRCVLWCLPWQFVVWWCCSGASWRPAVPCCVLWCCVALWCRAAGPCCAFCFAAGVRFSSKNYFAVFENKNKKR